MSRPNIEPGTPRSESNSTTNVTNIIFNYRNRYYEKTVYCPREMIRLVARFATTRALAIAEFLSWETIYYYNISV